ncbi:MULTISPECIES: SpoIID/LytB domain-containing protein [Dethiosulfovibrio]|uniref:SpoIID/LytB domain-containing protein n=2 Tax=Dethiosulfovibrio TaxID=47054 RepID=A0ABS9ELN9_9BACT|nr:MULTISPECIES: SpoIID/LytB domain-containing protein [Dethiosulfovibrio]MCF4113647.1 SpoIID/LytB domain-containing protein [Dethiosulfovibrio russensis]MCF4142117.1 SpoIID/LytB domain-containing protein [Dethiosulfovibrio marinus]MCF4144272.1 SpoIID/LytB domain-containing protein [Dethiosulfovibrio acidaminovorans]
MKQNRYSITVLFLTVISFVSLYFASPILASRNIKVGLGEGKSTVSLYSSAPLKASDKSGTVLSGKKGLSFSVSGHRLMCQGRSMVSPVTVVSSSPIVYEKRPYLGSFSLISIGGRLSVVNVLDIESYLRGVLKMEANPKWPMEALKVQAIISRTYALRSIGRHGAKGYDVCATPHCQAYRGINAHDPVTDRAVRETTGMVVKYGGTLAKTFFHSDSGGMTAASENVWGGSVPYLRPVKDPVPSNSPHSRWSISLSGSQLGKALARGGYSIGSVTDIKINSLDGSGRVLSMTLRGTKGSKTMSGHRFRMVVGSKVVKSTAFKIVSGAQSQAYDSIESGNQSARSDEGLTLEEESLIMTLTKQGAFSSEELIAMLVDPAKKRELLDKRRGTVTRKVQKPSSFPNSGYSRSNGTFLLEGTGWGHGVGLSQWGARALALAGWDAKRIVEYYYPGTVVSSDGLR